MQVDLQHGDFKWIQGYTSFRYFQTEPDVYNDHVFYIYIYMGKI